MHIIDRYGRLSVWNKLGVWGAIASFSGTLLAILALLFGSASPPRDQVQSQTVRPLLEDVSGLDARRAELAMQQIVELTPDVGPVLERLSDSWELLSLA